MPIKNYTTEVDFSKTVVEITGLLVSHGARSVQIDYDEAGKPLGVQFVFPVGGIPVMFQLPSNVDGVWAALQKQHGVYGQYRTREHARKVSWRILKDWVAAQMAIVEAGAAQLAEVFLPYAMHRDGKTMFQMFENSQKALAESNANPPAETR